MSKLFKATLKQGNKSSSVILDCNSWQDALAFLEAATTQKVMEIYEVCYQSSTEMVPIDDFNYNKSFSCMIWSNQKMWQMKIYNVKKTLNAKEIESLIMQHLKVRGQTPDRIFVEAFKV